MQIAGHQGLGTAATLTARICMKDTNSQADHATVERTPILKVSWRQKYLMHESEDTRQEALVHSFGV